MEKKPGKIEQKIGKVEKLLIDVGNISKDVAFIMSMPRLAFTDNMFCLINAVHELGLYGQRHCGVFWEQGVENLLEDATESGFKYGLAIDYDTYFTKFHLIDLYRTMEKHPEIDVLFPLQSKRGHKYPIAGVFNDEQGDIVKVAANREFVDGISEADTGHFGLTLIRLESLKRLSKPWFISKPNKDNNWRLHHKDADINFWIKCKHDGLKVALAEVFIGHMELMCSWCGSDAAYYKTHYVAINDVLDGSLPGWTTPKSLSENIEMETKNEVATGRN